MKRRTPRSGRSKRGPARGGGRAAGPPREAPTAAVSAKDLRFPEVLDRTVIAVPLLRKLEAGGPGETRHHHRREPRVPRRPEGRPGQGQVDARTASVAGKTRPASGPRATHRRRAPAHLRPVRLRHARRGGHPRARPPRRPSRQEPGSRSGQAIYHIWPDFPLKPLINRSISTVKADAAHNSFAGVGERHRVGGDRLGHRRHAPALSQAPEPRPAAAAEAPRLHVAPGERRSTTSTATARTWPASSPARDDEGRRADPRRATRHRDENGNPPTSRRPLDAIAGMAPRCKLLSLKVLDADGNGQRNRAGRAASSRPFSTSSGSTATGGGSLVHGVNLSVGYDFEPEWFACGQSPLCVEVDRLVRLGRGRGRRRRQLGLRLRAERASRASSPRGWTSPSTIPATPSSRSPSARPIATCRTSTACRTSRRRARRATAG